MILLSNQIIHLLVFYITISYIILSPFLANETIIIDFQENLFHMMITFVLL